MYNRSGCGLLVHLALLLQYVVDLLGREGTLQFLPIQQLLFKHIKRLHNNNETPTPVTHTMYSTRYLCTCCMRSRPSTACMQCEMLIM